MQKSVGTGPPPHTLGHHCMQAMVTVSHVQLTGITETYNVEARHHSTMPLPILNILHRSTCTHAHCNEQLTGILE
jgi:hypothetical protein